MGKCEPGEIWTFAFHPSYENFSTDDSRIYAGDDESWRGDDESVQGSDQPSAFDQEFHIEGCDFAAGEESYVDANSLPVVGGHILVSNGLLMSIHIVEPGYQGSLENAVSGNDAINIQLQIFPEGREQLPSPAKVMERAMQIFCSGFKSPPGHLRKLLEIVSSHESESL